MAGDIYISGKKWVSGSPLMRIGQIFPLRRPDGSDPIKSDYRLINNASLSPRIGPTSIT